jgi:hypothetical protein
MLYNIVRGKWYHTNYVSTYYTNYVQSNYVSTYYTMLWADRVGSAPTTITSSASAPSVSTPAIRLGLLD